MAEISLPEDSSKTKAKKKKTTLRKPPDGGWGWVVVFASLMIHIIADGIAYSFGVFYYHIGNDLNETKNATSWVFSIMSGITYGCGPIAGAFVNKYGCRKVSIAGTIIATFGFGISYFATSLTFLYFSIGIIGGLGLGMIYLPAIVSVTTYFDQKRAFATGIAVCGSGLGTFIFAPLNEYLIQEYKWRGALLILSFIISGILIFSAMFRPLEDVEIEEEDENENPENNITDSAAIEVEGQETKNAKDVVPSIKEPLESQFTQPLLASELARFISEKPDNNNRFLKTQLPLANGKDPIKARILAEHYGKDKLTMSSSQPVFPVGIGGSTDSLNKVGGDILINGSPKKMLTMFGSDMAFITTHDNASRARLIRHSFQPGLLIKRKDIFYSGSLLGIQELKSKHENSQQSYSQAVIRTPPDSSTEEISPGKFCCGIFTLSPEFQEVFRTMMDYSILKNPIFLFFAISNFLTAIGYNIPYVYLFDYAIKDNDAGSASFLISIIGISNTISRVVLGYLSDKEWVNRLYLYNIALTICGVSTGLSSLSTNINWLRVCAATFGASVGVFVSLTSVLLVDLIGLSKLTNGFGILLFFQGLATVIGPPIVGFLFDIFKNYIFGFSLAGAMLSLSGLMLFFIPCLKRRKSYSASFDRSSSENSQNQNEDEEDEDDENEIMVKFSSNKNLPNGVNKQAKIFSNNNTNTNCKA